MSKKNKFVSAPGQENMVEEIAEDFDTFETWMIQNWKIALLVGVAVILAIAGVVLARQIVKSNNEKAALVFANATDIASVQQAIAKYPSNVAVPAARIKLASLFSVQNKLPEAVAELKLVSSSSADAFLRTRAALDTAYILEKQGRIDEALNQFEQLTRNPALAADQKAEAAYSAARLYVDRRNFDSARALLNTVSPSMNQQNGAYQAWAEKVMYLKNRLPAAAAKPAVKPAL